MFLTLLIAEVLISLVISWYIVRILRQPIGKILNRITSDETSRAWLKYVKFAIYVAGLSGGVRLAERDIDDFGMRIMEIGSARFDSRMYTYMVSRLTLEIYSTIIGALKGIFWFLALFFIIAASAFVILRVAELVVEVLTLRVKSKPVDPQDRA
ncbi:MAG TPA: hypothetical protein VF543_22135 [Pyrinomonadaceae bacterium]|jgi:hypothetical protein